MIRKPTTSFSAKHSIILPLLSPPSSLLPSSPTLPPNGFSRRPVASSLSTIWDSFTSLTSTSISHKFSWESAIHVSYFFYPRTLSLLVYNNGEGAYLSEHSSRRTIESNTGIETAVGHSSMFIGGLALMVIFHVTATPTLPLAPGHNSTIAPVTSKSFTDQQINVIYGTMFALNVISVAIFALLPTKQYDSIASKSSTVIPSFKTQLSM